MTLLMIGSFFMGGLVLGRAVAIQLIQDSRIESLARRQFQSKVLLRPRRGSILDRNSEPLAVNIETQSLAANPSKIINKKTLANLLSKVTDIPHSKILEKLGEKKEFVWIKRHLSDNELLKLKKWRILDTVGNLVSGLWIVKESKRVYPHAELASHVLGDVNVDSEGLEGVELWANERLQGKVVSVNAIKDALGRPTFIDAVAANFVKDGDPVSLTLDASLQFAVEEDLRNSVIKANARGGSVIVMNAVTGEILAMANEPTFNPNDKSAANSKRRNRSLTDGYEPGSTLKAVLLASALSHGWKLSDRVWGERGSFLLQGKLISEAEIHEQFEWLSLKQVIQLSSNIGAAKLALRVGADLYSNTLRNFGFGIKTGTGFPGEISGRLLPRKSWQPLSLATIGFGQGILVTPMQMLRAYAVFANGGWLVQPVLLKTPIKGFSPEPPRKVLSKKVCDSVVESLRSVTEGNGTGLNAKLEGYQIAGKTGTAQVVDSVTGKYSHSHYIASFIGFATGVDQKFVIFTSIDEPKGVYYASETAAPLFKEVLNAVVNRFSIPSTEKKALVVAQSSKNGTGHALLQPLLQKDELSISYAKPIESLKWHGTSADGMFQWQMPSLKKLTLREALRVLQGHPFHLEAHGTGIIRSQIPEAGQVIEDGATVRLQLAGE